MLTGQGGTFFSLKAGWLIGLRVLVLGYSLELYISSVLFCDFAHRMLSELKDFAHRMLSELYISSVLFSLCILLHVV
jgi:hypothetical protein